MHCRHPNECKKRISVRSSDWTGAAMNPLTLQNAVRRHLKNQDLADLKTIAEKLWNAGIPNRLIQLPEAWWDTNASIDSGLWIAQTCSEPFVPWLVSKGPTDQLSVKPLLEQSSKPPNPSQFDRLVLSLWPGIDELPNLWNVPANVLTVQVLSSVLWLSLPIVLISKPMLILVFLTPLLLLRASVQPQRLILTSAQYSIAALHHLLRIPVTSFVHLQDGLGLGFINLQNDLTRRLPEQLQHSLVPLCVLTVSSAILIIEQRTSGIAILLILIIWLISTTIISLRSKPLLMRRQREDECSDERSFQLLMISNTLRLAAAEERALAWWEQPLNRARSCQQDMDRLNTLRLVSSWFSVGLCYLLAFNNNWSSFQLMQLSLAIVAAQQLSRHLHSLFSLRTESILDSKLMTSPTEWQDHHQHPGILQGDVQLQQVWFRYGPSLPWALRDVNLSMPTGSFTALVGPSGSGKSTLLHLLLGFGELSQGHLLFDGQTSDRLQQDLLRPQIGAMLQNSRLVGDTLLDVISAGRTLEIEQALEALEAVGFGPDLKDLPMGLETPLPDGGRQLSGGQRQKLALARALIGSPALLLLDEPTSSLDAMSQKHVLETLLTVSATRLVVAHRLSTIELADQIVVMDQGQIVQVGTYHELRKSPGLFATLMRHQDS